MKIPTFIGVRGGGSGRGRLEKFQGNLCFQGKRTVTRKSWM